MSKAGAKPTACVYPSPQGKRCPACGQWTHADHNAGRFTTLKASGSSFRGVRLER